MKLPGIQYRGVAGLAKEDVGAPIRLAAAEAGASRAWSQVMRPAVEGADEIMTDIARDRSSKAMNIYHEEKLKWQSEQIALDENGDPAWENGGERFNSADEAARAAASKVIGNSVHGQTLFDQTADKANVQYGASWQNKVKSWYNDDQMATANASIELATQQRDFDRVSEIVADNSKRGIFTRVQTEKLFAVNSANRVNSEYLTAIDLSNTIGGYSKLRKDINIESKLTDEARKQMSTRLDNHIIESNGAKLRQALTTIENNLGLEAAVVAGDIVIHEQAKINKEEFDGFDAEPGRQKHRNAQRAIWSEWKSRLTKKTAESKRREGLECSVKGTCPPTTGKTDDQQKADDVLAQKLGWELEGKRDYNKNNVESGIILKDDARGLALRQMMASDYNRHGYVGKPTREVLDAAFTSNDPALMKAGIQLYNMLSKDSPGAVVAKQAKIVEKYSDIIQSFPEDIAVSMIMKNKSLSPVEQGHFRDSFDAQKFDDSGFQTVMAANMPADSWFFGVDVSPSYKDTFKRNVEAKAKDLMPMVGGDINAAYKAATNVVSKSYGTDKTTGRVVKQPFATSIFGGNVDDGEWVHDEIKKDLPGFNNGEMPDAYDYYPSPNFDPLNNPEYVISWVNEQGEYKAIGGKFRFDETDRGKEYAKEEAEKSAELERQRLLTIDKQTAMSSDEAWKNATLDTRLSVTVDDVGQIFGNMFGKAGTAVEVAKGVSDYLVSGTYRKREEK